MRYLVLFALPLLVVFAPEAAATYEGVLDLGPDVPAVSFTGIGAVQGTGSACLVVPDSIDFGFVLRGHPTSSSFRDSNAPANAVAMTTANC